jgi:predicted RNA-binding Zn-ribbon protein involved in translation (DUF1610 family)
MFFPCLENLRKAKFPQQSIDLFDWWLGTRRQNTLHNLNPLQFSLDCNLDLQHSLKIFSHCVFDPEIALLSRNLSVVCPNCGKTIQKTKESIDKKRLKCTNCGTVVSETLLSDCTIISFELLKLPERPLEGHPLETIPNGVFRGNAPSLRVSDLQKNSEGDDDIRRLIDCL